MRERIVIAGFGVTGAGAARFMLQAGVRPAEVAVVDRRADVVEEAIALGVRGHVGDATGRAALAEVVSEHTRFVVVTVRPDAAAVMATMLARDLCPDAVVVTAVHDDDNEAHALRAGANQVVTTSRWTGRALALALA